MTMRSIIDMSADRGVYIDQSQSMNLFMRSPDYRSLTAMITYGWEKGLKTGMYYLRRMANHTAQQFTIEPTKATFNDNNKIDTTDVGSCEMCSS